MFVLKYSTYIQNQTYINIVVVIITRKKNNINKKKLQAETKRSS